MFICINTFWREIWLNASNSSPARRPEGINPYSIGNQSPQSSLTFSMSSWQRKRSWTSLRAEGGTASLIHTCRNTGKVRLFMQHFSTQGNSEWEYVHLSFGCVIICGAGRETVSYRIPWSLYRIILTFHKSGAAVKWVPRPFWPENHPIFIRRKTKLSLPSDALFDSQISGVFIPFLRNRNIVFWNHCIFFRIFSLSLTLFTNPDLYDNALEELWANITH